MNSTSISRSLVSKTVSPLSAATATRCTATRWYATTGPRTPKTSATTKKITTATKTSSRASNGEEESIAARTPLRKPTTTGLGVPSKSPSALLKPSPAKSSTSKHAQSISPSAVSSTEGDAEEKAERREAQLRIARLRRVDQEAQQAAKEEAEKAYKERYNGAARRWVSGIIAMPILLVTSWYLFDRREFILVSWEGGELTVDSCAGQPAQADSQG